MRKGSFMKTGIYKILDYIARLVILNILIFIISLSFVYIFKDHYWPLIITLFTIFPSIVATFKVIKDYEGGENPTIFKPFFRAFKKYYFKSLIISFIIALICGLLLNSLIVFQSNYNQNVANIIGFYLTISVMIIVVFMIIHLPLVIVNFDGLRVFQYLKLSIIMGFKDILMSFLIIVVCGVFILTAVSIPVITGCVGISLPIYIITRMTYRRYIVLSSKHSLKDE